MAEFEWVPAPAPAQAAAPGGTFVPRQEVPGIPPLDVNSIDTRSGAPWNVRLGVGAAEKPEDKLATLRRYYSNADHYPGEPDRLVYLDPQSNTWRAVNPKGLDIGDMFGAVPEIGEALGGIGGGALAAITTVPPALVAAPPTFGASLAAPAVAIPTGVGLGAAGGRELAQTAAKFIANTVDTRTLPEHLIDTATTVGSNAVFSKAGDLIASGARAVMPKLAGLRDAFTRTGVEPTVGQVSGRNTLAASEKGIANVPGGAGRMQDHAETQLRQLGDAAKRLFDEFASGAGATTNRAVTSKVEAGEGLQSAGQAAVNRFKGRSLNLYDDAFDLVGRESPTTLNQTQRLIGEMEAELAGAPGSLASTTGRVVGEARTLLDDAAHNGGAISFETLRRVRTKIGQELDDPVLVGASSAYNSARKRLYGALTDDMKAVASASGDDATEAMTKADRYYRMNMSQNVGPGTVIDKLMKAGTPEQAFDFAMSGAKDGASKLMALKRNFSKEEWDALAGTVLGRLGTAKAAAQDAAGDVFSPQTFLSSYNTMSKEARDALFMGSRYASLRGGLDDLAKVSEAIRNAERMANPSGTARVLQYGGLLQALGVSGYQMLTTGGMEGLALTGAGVVSANAASRLMTSPAFVRWLADAGKQTLSPATDGLANHLGRLAGVAKLNPAIRDEVREFVDVLGRTAQPVQGQQGQQPTR